MVKKNTNTKNQKKHRIIYSILPTAVSTIALVVAILIVRSIYISDSSVFNSFIEIAIASWVVVLIPALLAWILQLIIMLHTLRSKTRISKKAQNKLYTVSLILALVWIIGWAYIISKQPYDWRYPVDFWLTALIPVGILIFFCPFVAMFYGEGKLSIRGVFKSFALIAIIGLLLLFMMSYIFFVAYMIFSLG